MRLGEQLVALENQLEAVGEERAALSYVFKEIKNWTTTDLILNLQTELTPADERLLTQLSDQLKRHVPAQYITGQAYFRDLTLAVDSRVLIPRPETEELVELMLQENGRAGLRVLDIGTGSGAIALSLARHGQGWQVTASDLSADALAVARHNAAALGLPVTLVQSDVFDQIEGAFDIIVSNPPYIAYEDTDEVGQNVLHHEPHMALFADKAGLAIYEKIVSGAAAHLSKEGKIYLEIGYKQGAAVAQLFQEAFPGKRVRVLKDAFGQDRMVVVDNG